VTDSIPGLVFPAVRGRAVVVKFDGGDLTSDAGLTLIAAADRRLGLTEALAEAALDRRQAGKVQHPLAEILRTRIYAIAQGYEDANDLDRLREDPALKTACGRLPQSGAALASQPTISRMENGLGKRELVLMGRALAESVIAQLPEDSPEVILDVDVTDDPCHGQQQLQIFNAFYNEHCYLPLLLYVTGSDGRQRLAAGLLRGGNVASTRGLWRLLQAVVGMLRRRQPKVRIILRGDSGFGVEKVLAWCHRLDISYLLGLASNPALQRKSTPIQMDAALKYRWEGDGCREFGEFQHTAKSWRQPERVIIKAEITRGELNPRYLVTDVKLSPEQSYHWYCQRGDRENRIKEFKLDLAGGRTSCHRFLANQARLLLHVAACALLNTMQAALVGTRWATAQVNTLRTRLLKVGARVIQSTRRIWLHLSSAFPEQKAWCLLYHRLTTS